MEKFADLGVSFFDPDFSLSPHKYLADRTGLGIPGKSPAGGEA